MKNKKSGFTTVEVMVVIVIIFLLFMIFMAGKVIGPEYTTEIRNGHRFIIRESHEWGEIQVSMSHDPDCSCHVTSGYKSQMPEKE